MTDVIEPISPSGAATGGLPWAEGTKLPDGFEVIREIGQGAMSVVYLVAHEGQRFAAKVMRETSGAAGIEAALRFRREASALGRLRDPGLVRVFEGREISGRPALLMEYCDGVSLDETLRQGPMSEAQTRTVGIALARALNEAHRHGLVHRDVKPANIICTSTGPKLIDFGFVMSSADGIGTDGNLGTAVYAAPEQMGVLKREVDARADLYSLGVTFFECLTGKPPFQAESAGELIHMHAKTRAPHLRERRPDISPAFDAIVDKLLSKEPSERYLTGEGLASDLERLDELNQKLSDGVAIKLGVQDRPSRNAHDVALTGRDKELATLQQVVRDTRAGRGQIVLVEGESGSGKSRLVREVFIDAERSAMSILSCKCQLGEQVPLGPLREAIDTWVVKLNRLPEAEREPALDRARRAAGDYGGLLAKFSRGLSQVLSGAAGAQATAGAQEQFFGAIADFFVGVAGDDGALLHVDDVQWLDPSSLQVITLIAERMASTRLMIVGTCRNDSASTAAEQRFVSQMGSDLKVRLTLGPLDTKAIATLVGSHLQGHALRPELVDRLTRLSNGNPFAISEYVRTMLQSGVIVQTDDGYALDEERLKTVHLPTDVVDLVVTRMATLEAEVSEVLATGAIIGSTFEVDLISDVVGKPEGVLAEFLDKALAGAFIERTDEKTFAFVHDRIREALLHRLGPQETKTIHHRTAVTLDKRKDTSSTHVFRLARHYSSGFPEQVPLRAFEVDLAAGQAALDAFANQQAFDFLARAHQAAKALDVKASTRATLEEVLGTACTRTARIADAVTYLASALEKVDEPLVKARIHMTLCRVQTQLWNSDGAWQECQNALSALGTPFPKSELGRVISTWWYQLAHWFYALTRIRFGKAEGASFARVRLQAAAYAVAGFMSWSASRTRLLRQLTPRLQFAIHFLGDRRESVEPLSNLALMMGGLRSARAGNDAAVRAIRIGEQIGDRALLAAAKRIIGMGSHMWGDYAFHEQVQRSAIFELQNFLLPRDFIAGCNDLSSSLIDRGFAKEAVAVAKRGLEMADKTKLPNGSSNIRAVLAAAEAMLGDFADATKHLLESHAIAKEKVAAKDSWSWLWILAYSSLYHLEQGELGEPFAAVVEQFLSYKIKPSDLPYFHHPFFVFRAYARRAQYFASATADKRRAREALDEALVDLAAVSYDPLKAANLALLRASLERDEGHFDAALELTRRAAEHAASIQAPSIAFEVALERARIATRQGRSATEQVAEALRVAEERGWKRRAAALREEFSVKTASTEVSGPVETKYSGGDRDLLRVLLQVSLASSQALDPAEQARATLDEIVKILSADRAFSFSWTRRASRTSRPEETRPARTFPRPRATARRSFRRSWRRRSLSS